MLHPWETLSSRIIHQDRWIHLRADSCRRHDGLVIEPFYVLEMSDFVHVLPVLEDGRLLLVRQWRHGGNTFSLELPGGMLDAGETPEQGARRELLEECGAEGSDWSLVHRFFPNPARQNNLFHAFLARGVRRISDQQLDGNEEIEIHAHTVAEVDAAIASGEFNQGNHIAAYLLARPQLVGETAKG
ncbi:NUDIX hydrolase [Actomonas aquatica]|uniref:GDP-mannose pyrophosphatase n=1 Tax=Actomonas aquatica TaxID=2866162 RepID=A0ABZ1C3E6_9BACT|nr:NUDIX hydrolase [Opitutus sp. WL0086]WRQ86231.1 NUDIX hydrolase [Opitutus sp. WL0086]